MYASYSIRRHIWKIAENQMFCNRDLLKYGPRALVDKVLSNLARKEAIIRIARGVYIRNTFKLRLPSLAEIAQFKAETFGRRIKTTMENAAKVLGLIKEQKLIEHTYITDGYSSSFLTSSGIRIFFRRCATRKIELKDDIFGLAIKAFWHFREPLAEVNIRLVTSQMHFSQRKELRLQARLMPAWMSDVLGIPNWEERRIPIKENAPLFQ